MLSGAVILAGCGSAQTSPAPLPSTSWNCPRPISCEVGCDVAAATGEAQLIVAPDGSYKLVLESFTIPSIEHTNIVLVKNADVTATADVDKSMLLDLGPFEVDVRDADLSDSPPIWPAA